MTWQGHLMLSVPVLGVVRRPSRLLWTFQLSGVLHRSIDQTGKYQGEHTHVQCNE